MLGDLRPVAQRRRSGKYWQAAPCSQSERVIQDSRKKKKLNL
jgi:hypothetical protein